MTYYPQQSSSFLPLAIIDKWQNISNILANILKIPAALIMKTDQKNMEVFISSQSPDNPYHMGEKEAWDGLYCETVIKSNDKLLVSNALKSEQWNKNPDLKLGMIAYLGFPINYPDKTPFGTICVLDKKENNFSTITEKLILEFRDVIEMDLAIFDSFDEKTDQLNDTIKDQVIAIHKTKVELQEKNIELHERIKELNGIAALYEASNNVESIPELIAILTRDIIPGSMQFPEQTFSTVIIDGQGFTSCPNKLQRNTNYLKSTIRCNNAFAGELQIGYVDKEFPFIPEFEQKLVDAYAWSLGKIIENFRTKNKIKQALLQSEESNKKHQEIIELAPDAFLQGNSKKSEYLLNVNNKTCELTAYTRSELKTMKLKELFTLESIENKPFRYDLINIGETVISERILKRKDGTEIAVETISKLMPDRSFVSFMRDITDRKLAEKTTLERNEYKLRAELTEIQNQLSKERIENQERERVALQLSFENQKKDVTDLALEISAKVKMNIDILARINNIKNAVNEECKAEFEKVEKIIQTKLRTDRNPIYFQNKIDRLNTDFYSKITTSFPQLTKGDLELISKIRLKLSNKDIASLLNINHASVNIKRYRLRKKLNLEAEQDLDDFLNSI